MRPSRGGGKPKKFRKGGGKKNFSPPLSVARTPMMRMISKNAIPTLVAFGGIDNEHGHLDSIEEWDPDNKKWKLLEQKLFHKRCF